MHVALHSLEVRLTQDISDDGAAIVRERREGRSVAGSEQRSGEASDGWEGLEGSQERGGRKSMWNSSASLCGSHPDGWWETLHTQHAWG